MVYGSEAVLPAEIAVESFRIQHYSPEMNDGARLLDLDLLDAKRQEAHAKIMAYKAQVTRMHDQRVRPRQLQVGDLVLKKVEITKHVGKLEPNWDGPFKIVEARGNGSCKLETMQGKPVPRTWNVQDLKKYYA
jgi:hypothetical protein